MILLSPTVGARELEPHGWTLTPEGACSGGRCVPLPEGAMHDGRIEARVLAERLRMPLLHDREHGLWCLGPEMEAPKVPTEPPLLELPDLEGRPHSLAALRGRKVLLVAWASW